MAAAARQRGGSMIGWLLWTGGGGAVTIQATVPDAAATKRIDPASLLGAQKKIVSPLGWGSYPGHFEQERNKTLTDVHNSRSSVTILDNLGNPRSAPELPKYTTCTDLRVQCPDWAAAGQCQKRPTYMQPHCPRSCQTCGQQTRLAHPGTVSSDQSLIPDPSQITGHAVGRDLGVPQIVPDESAREQIEAALDQARRYITEVVMEREQLAAVRSLCRNHHPFCAFWSSTGECQNNPAYMSQHCSPMCGQCDRLHIQTKCPLDPNVKNIWYPGDLEATFTRMVTDPVLASKYQVVVHSRPDYAPGDHAGNATYQVGGPWVITIDHVLTEEETQRIIEIGTELGYERSMAVGGKTADGTNEDIVSTSRTSLNTWCDRELCTADPLVQQVHAKLLELTQIPPTHWESLQLLRYQVGQFYLEHSDYIPYQYERPCGVRILTAFIYLNDVEQGGETNMPALNLSVRPARGRLLLWPSVLNDNPHEMDVRTNHQALPVMKGVKYAANAWFHQRDFVAASAQGCT